MNELHESITRQHHRRQTEIQGIRKERNLFSMKTTLVDVTISGLINEQKYAVKPELQENELFIVSVSKYLVLYDGTCM